MRLGRKLARGVIETSEEIRPEPSTRPVPEVHEAERAPEPVPAAAEHQELAGRVPIR